MSRSLTSDPRGRFIGLGRAYAEYLYDYAQELTGDPVIAGEVVENALTAATAYFEHADFGQVQADRARAERVRARRADLSRIGSWSEQAQIWAEEARADADPAGLSAPGRRAAESIRPWLYATVRRECMARVQAAGGRLSPSGGPSGRHAAELAATAADGSGASRSAAGGPWADEAVADALTSEFEVTELQAEELRVQVAAVNQVLSGLPEEASEILGLAVRHGLGDDDIAVAMGMSRRQAAQERAEAAAQFDRLAVTVLLLRAGWSGCERLDKMLGGSYPTTEPPSDKLCVKVSKHSENCMICGRIVASRGFGPELLSVLAISRLPRPVRQQLGRISRELGRDSQPPMPDREQARRRARAGRAVPAASGASAAASAGASEASAGAANAVAAAASTADASAADASAAEAGAADASAAEASAVSAGAASTEVADVVGADAGGDEAAGDGAAEVTESPGGPAADPATPASAPTRLASPVSLPDGTATLASATAGTASQGTATPVGGIAASGTPDTGASAGTGQASETPSHNSPENASPESVSSNEASSDCADPNPAGPGRTSSAGTGDDRAAAANSGPGWSVADSPATITMAVTDKAAGPGASAWRTDRRSPDRHSAGERSPSAPDGGSFARATGVTAGPPWDAPTTIDAVLPYDPAHPDLVTIGAESERPGSWLTRPRAAVVSALAIMVIVAGIMLAAKFAAAPATHPDSRPSPAVANTPSPATSGTAPAAAARATQHARKHGQTTTSAPPGVVSSTQPGTTPPAASSSAPSHPKPSPTPTKSKKPSPPPSTSAPPPSTSPPTVTPTPTPTTPTP